MIGAAFRRLFGGSDTAQLALSLDDTPATADELLRRLRALGLPSRYTRVRLTNNRTVMVSFSRDELRVHAAYLGAPRDVHLAMVAFLAGRTRAVRQQARSVILAHPIERAPARARRAPRTLPEDRGIVDELRRWHDQYNERLFDGTLRRVTLRVSRKMESRLGHYTAAAPGGTPAEIAIGRQHLERHGWTEVLHTLLHEMVHQWQDETGRPIDHGAGFRAKAREVGITAAARRTVRARRGPAVPPPAPRPVAEPHD